MIRRTPSSKHLYSSAASDVYKSRPLRLGCTFWYLVLGGRRNRTVWQLFGMSWMWPWRGLTLRQSSWYCCCTYIWMFHSRAFHSVVKFPKKDCDELLTLLPIGVFRAFYGDWRHWHSTSMMWTYYDHPRDGGHPYCCSLYTSPSLRD